MSAYYNEHDPFAAAWLRELIKAGHIAPGDVDERDIQEVSADDLRPYIQVHFFAGIGGWSYALRLAKWPDDRPVWTGSCPCQPFSAAGKQQGESDERHLWPEMFRLVRECNPGVVFGEQVEAAISLGWLDGVFTDLEGAGYACGSAVLGAHSVGAPHIRQRLFWVADASGTTSQRRTGRLLASQEGVSSEDRKVDGDRSVGLTDGRQDRGLADAAQRGLSEQRGACSTRNGGHDDGGGEVEWLGHSEQPRLEGHAGNGDDGEEPGRINQDAVGSVAAAGRHCWDGAILIPCGDGKARRIEPGTTPLAYGVPARVGRLRGYGNAIVPQVAAAFIRAYCEATAEGVTT